jgi:hypothetical protein
MVHLWSKNSKLKYYSKLVQRDTNVRDDRSGREILESVKKKLRERKERRGNINETV